MFYVLTVVRKYDFSPATTTLTAALVDYDVLAPDTICIVELKCPGLDGTSYDHPPPEFRSALW